jgi:hypothetical protein
MPYKITCKTDRNEETKLHTYTCTHRSEALEIAKVLREKDNNYWIVIDLQPWAPYDVRITKTT